MPPPSSENDLKRLARRRLIGAVALTLIAVIVLPLLLENEPPPTSSLSVHMAAAPAPVPDQTAQPERTDQAAAVAAPATPALPEPPSPPSPPEPAKPLSKPAPPHEAAKPAPVEPVKVEPAKPAPKPPKPAAAPAHQLKPEAAGEMFVVQLAALSDGAKAHELKARAALAGLPAYTDTVGNLTRVRAGPYATREAAVAAVEKLRENGMTGQVLSK
jgi:DedD protein